MAMTAGTTTTSFPMSNHTRERVTVAKLTLENFYSNLIIQHEERETRYGFHLFLVGFLRCFFKGTLVPRSCKVFFLYLVARSLSLKGTGYIAAAGCASRPVNIPCYCNSRWVTEDLHFWHFIQSTSSSDYYYFVETALCRVLLCSTCKFSASACEIGDLQFRHACHRE